MLIKVKIQRSKDLIALQKLRLVNFGLKLKFIANYVNLLLFYEISLYECTQRSSAFIIYPFEYLCMYFSYFFLYIAIFLFISY